MSSRIRKALSAGIATAMLGAAAIAFAPTIASADALMARSECIGGFWHVITYDVTNPNAWVVTADEPTSQPCGGQALALNFFDHLGHELLRDEVFHGRGDFGHDMRRGGEHEHFSGIQVRSGRD